MRERKFKGVNVLFSFATAIGAYANRFVFQYGHEYWGLWGPSHRTIRSIRPHDRVRVFDLCVKIYCEIEKPPARLQFHSSAYGSYPVGQSGLGHKRPTRRLFGKHSRH